MIHSLGESSIRHICCGQVIVDLSTAIKELVENSLDANASVIEVVFKEYAIPYHFCYELLRICLLEWVVKPL